MIRADLEPGDLAGVLGRLPLTVVKIGRDRDHGLADLVAQIALRRFLELSQDQRRDLGRRVVFLVGVDLDEVARPPDDLVRDHLFFGLDLVMAAAHEPLDRVDRLGRVGDRLALRRVADQHVSLGRESHHRRRETTPLLIGDHRHIAPLHHRDDAVRRSQIDANNLFALSHDASPFRR